MELEVEGRTGNTSGIRGPERLNQRNGDAIYVKVRHSGRIVYVAVTIAIGVNNDGRHEVLGHGL